ncbi:MAPEG family protein [Shewanella electrodiphila]|uniref:MAPEG family protein n=1 Tax=Shewanella electrodiphila TaxID=934143 RepID=A0ABT0KSF5_9GAMM|nr:MAPEG family protein [Shewanella electrodiphila]MCL1046584.1 MAPEG family protein [Shewanella electrodiphila]
MPISSSITNKLTSKQRDVTQGIVIGMLVSFAVVIYGALANPFEYSEPQSLIERLVIYAYGMILPTLSLIIAVGRVAKHRFFSAKDIDGSSYYEQSERVRRLQSVLQNTLEQFCIVMSVYFLWAFIMPADYMSLIGLISILFFIGRILFMRGYDKGAGARSIGFSLTFYPSVLTVGAIIIYLFYRTFT